MEYKMAQYIQVELCSLCSSGVGSSKVGAQRQGWHGGVRGGGSDTICSGKSRGAPSAPGAPIFRPI